MKTREEIRDWILENCIDKDENVNLCDLDFGKRGLILSKIKAKWIDNEGQKASEQISNNCQFAEENIRNGFQKSEIIWNNNQEAATSIANEDQKANHIYNFDQEADKIYT